MAFVAPNRAYDLDRGRVVSAARTCVCHCRCSAISFPILQCSSPLKLYCACWVPKCAESSCHQLRECNPVHVRTNFVSWLRRNHECLVAMFGMGWKCGRGTAFSIFSGGVARIIKVCSGNCAYPPYRFQSRNHGLFAYVSSCFLFAAFQSAIWSRLVSGSVKMCSSNFISLMVAKNRILVITRQELK